MTLEEKLDYFYKSTIEDATNHSIAAIDEYKESLNKIFENSKDNIMKKADVSFNAESKNLNRDKNKVLSNEQIELRRQLNEKTELLIENLFMDVVNKVNIYRTTREYMENIIKQVLEAKEFAKTDDIIVYLSLEDESIKTEVSEKTSTRVEIEASSFLGGTQIIIPSKNILVDNSFSSKIIEQKESFTI